MCEISFKMFFFSLILYITVHLPLLIICLCSSAACCIVFNILQRILNPVLWCFTSHLSPLISTPASVISISPPLPFLFFKRPFLSPLMSLITSTPFLSPPTCTLHNPPSSLDSHVLLDPFPPLSLFSVFLRDSRFTIVITFFLPVLSLWLSCYHCSGNKFSWQSLFFLSLHLPHSKSTTCDLLLSAVAIYFPSSSFKFKLSSINCSRALLQTMPFHCQPHTLPHSLPLLLSCYHVCGLSLCAHLMAGV